MRHLRHKTCTLSPPRENTIIQSGGLLPFTRKFNCFTIITNILIRSAFQWRPMGALSSWNWGPNKYLLRTNADNHIELIQRSSQDMQQYNTEQTFIQNKFQIATAIFTPGESHATKLQHFPLELVISNNISRSCKTFLKILRRSPEIQSSRNYCKHKSRT